MAVGEEIFPEGCWLAYTDDGQLSTGGRVFMLGQRMSDWEGKGVEHPCYGCGKDDCEARQIDYQDSLKRYITPPK